MTTLEHVREILADQTQGFPQVAAATLDYLQHLEDRIAWLERDRRPWRAEPERRPSPAAPLAGPAPLEGGGPAPAPEAP